MLAALASERPLTLALQMLMAYYHLLSDKNGPQHCWAMIGLAAHMAQNVSTAVGFSFAAPLHGRRRSVCVCVPYR